MCLVLEYLFVSSLSEKILGAAAIGVCGMLLVGCDQERTPEFPKCTYDDADKSAVMYLRENALGVSMEMRIGNYLFKRETQQGPLTDNGVELKPNTELLIGNDNDGRDYDLAFSEHGSYTRVDVFSRCQSKGGIEVPLHPHIDTPVVNIPSTTFTQ